MKSYQNRRNATTRPLMADLPRWRPGDHPGAGRRPARVRTGRRREPAPAGRCRRPAFALRRPRPPQKMPNEVSITPTMNFMVFSGTPASGARSANPASAALGPLPTGRRSPPVAPVEALGLVAGSTVMSGSRPASWVCRCARCSPNTVAAVALSPTTWRCSTRRATYRAGPSSAAMAPASRCCARSSVIDPLSQRSLRPSTNAVRRSAASPGSIVG